MNALVRLLTLSLFLLFINTIAFAEEIYRWETPDGTTVYSDKPEPNVHATKIEQKLAPTIHLPSVKMSDIPKKVTPPDSLAYQSIHIVSPQNETTFSTPPSTVFVSVDIKPALQPNHRIVFLKDGLPVSAPSLATSVSVADLYRGSHTLQAQIVDAAGKRVISSKVTTIYVQQPSAPKK